MTRFEVIQRFANDARTHRDHRYTFFVLAEMWADAGRPDQFKPDFHRLLKLTTARRSNLYRWLGELDLFGYINYQKGSNQNKKLTVSFTVASSPNGTAEGLPVAQMGQRSDYASSPHETAGSSASVQHGTAEGSPVAQMGQHGSSPNETATATESQKQHNVDKPGGETATLVPTTDHLVSKAIHQDRRREGDEGKRVKGKNQKPRKMLQGCKFSDSAIFTVEAFNAAFATDATGQHADLNYYHQRVASWRDKHGDEPVRVDWISSARTFMLNDYKEGKLVTNVKPLYPHGSVSRNNTGRSRIEPAAGTKRSFGGSF